MIKRKEEKEKKKKEKEREEITKRERISVKETEEAHAKRDGGLRNLACLRIMIALAADARTLHRKYGKTREKRRWKTMDGTK